MYSTGHTKKGPNRENKVIEMFINKRIENSV